MSAPVHGAPGGGDERPASNGRVAALVAVALLACAGFIALGQWQIERRAWKLDLIARVTQRLQAAPVAAPGPDEWPRVDAARDEYRRVHVVGTFMNDRETLVRASTALGSGWWVMTPLRTVNGYVVLVNRGFVPPERRDRATRAAAEPRGEVGVTGLLRLTEPRGALLRRNDPGAERWYSRDVQAIARSRGLERVAPYFIDADAAAPGDAAIPVGGLTVTTFYNAHLVYAITWYALGLLAAAAAARLLLVEARLRRGRAG